MYTSDHSELKFVNFLGIFKSGSHGVMVSTLDFESSDPSSNLGGTLFYFVYSCSTNTILHIIVFYLFVFRK